MNVRDWLYVEDHCDAVWTVLNKGQPRSLQHRWEQRDSNKRITEIILKEMGKKWDESVQYVKDRPGHDRRYAIDASKIKRELGWEPNHRFEDAIKTTIQWYRENENGGAR